MALFLAQFLMPEVCLFVCFFRAENGPGGWAIREAEGNPNRTEYVWLFDVDLKVTATRQAGFFVLTVNSDGNQGLHTRALDTHCS